MMMRKGDYSLNIITSFILSFITNSYAPELRNKNCCFFIEYLGYHHHICYDGIDVSRVIETYCESMINRKVVLTMHGTDVLRMNQYKHHHGKFAPSSYAIWSEVLHCEPPRQYFRWDPEEYAKKLWESLNRIILYSHIFWFIFQLNSFTMFPKCGMWLGNYNLLYKGKKYEFIEQMTVFSKKHNRAYLKQNEDRGKIMIALSLNKNFWF